MKKSLKIIAIVVVAILLVTIITPLVLRGKIGEIVKREAANMLNAKLDFDRLGISLLRHFPNASLDLNGLTIVGIDQFDQDTLVSADRISVVVNLMSLFSDSGFEVSKLILDAPSICALKNADGAVNWDIMKPTPEQSVEIEPVEASAFNLSMKDVRIKDGQIVFIDDSSKLTFMTSDLNLKLRGDMSAIETDLALKLTSEQINLSSAGMTMLRDANVEVVAVVNANLATNKYTLVKNTIKLNDIEVSIDGRVTMLESAFDMDLKVNSSKVKFKDILSLIPAFYTKDFKNLSASGELSLDMWANGRFEGDNVPAFDLHMEVVNGGFKYAALPKSVEGINISAHVTNKGGVVDQTVVDVPNFALAFAGNSLKATFYATTPISDMNFRATASGKVDLGAIKDVYPLGDSISLSGVVIADVKVASRMSDIEKQRYESIDASGKFAIEQMIAKLKDLPNVNISTMSATITPAAMTLSNLDMTVGASDISASGTLSNYLSYAMKGDKLTGTLNVNSKLLDLNELMGNGTESTPTEETTDTIAMSVVEVPENLNLTLNTSLGKILFQKMVISNLVGQITVASGELKMNRLNMNALGGTIAASGSYSTAISKTNPSLDMSLNIANASFVQTFKELDMIKKIVPIFEKTGGDYSMKMDMNTKLDAHMSPELMTLNANGLIQSSNIQLQNIKAFDAMAAALKDDRLKNIQVKDIKIPFTIADGKISTAPFDMKVGNIGINLSGMTGLDQSIDYNAKIALPAGMAGGYVNNATVHIGGTFTDPKISLDVKELATEAIKNVISKEITDKLTGGKDLGEEISKQADKLRTEAALAGDKLIEAARSEGDKLVEKASNPLTKIAARKAADLLVKKAEEQAQKLKDGAETQIEKITK